MRGDLGLELNSRRTLREVYGILVKAGAGKVQFLEKSVGIASRKVHAVFGYYPLALYPVCSGLLEMDWTATPISARASG